MFSILTVTHSYDAAHFALARGRPWLAAFVVVTALIALALCTKIVWYLYRPPSNGNKR